MSDRTIPTALDAGLLTEAFPKTLHTQAVQAAECVLKSLHNQHLTERFGVKVEQQIVTLPGRLYFASTPLAQSDGSAVHLAVRCLETRSSDGFQRQRAVREILTDIQPWSAPFIVAVIGEYVVEILHDIRRMLTPAGTDMLADFIAANPDYWQLTQARVVSYWNAYYRGRLRRNDYVGFKLVEALSDAACDRRRAAD